MPRQRRTLAEIAAWCDCSPSYLLKVERQALAKLRKKFPDEGEWIQEMAARYEDASY